MNKNNPEVDGILKYKKKRKKKTLNSTEENIEDIFLNLE